jgi:hypothetical protein
MGGLQDGRIVPDYLCSGMRACWHEDRKIPTDPMARKKEKVAALLSMVLERVDRTPRGPAPFLHKLSGGFSGIDGTHCIMLQDPKRNPIVSPTPPPINAPILRK